MRRFLQRGGRGFTLVEVTVAMGIFAIVMLGLAAVAGISAQGGHASKQRLRATYLANSMLENLASPILVSTSVDSPPTVFSYNNVRTDQPGSFPAGDTLCLPWSQDIANQLGPGARGVITVANDTPRPGRILITVTVSWLTRSGATQSSSVAGVR